MAYSVIDLARSYPLEERDLVRMNVGEQFWRCKLETIPDACDYKRHLKTWISKMPEMLKKGIGLILHGAWRMGKSGGATILLKAVHTHGGTGYMIRADHVAGAIVERERFDEDQTVEQRCCDVDLLVIDELGHGMGHGQTSGMIERLIRWRYDRRKPLVVTVNNLKLIDDRYGRGTAMVLRSRCLPVEVSGTNFYEEEKREVAELFGDGQPKE